MALVVTHLMDLSCHGPSVIPVSTLPANSSGDGSEQHRQRGVVHRIVAAIREECGGQAQWPP